MKKYILIILIAFLITIIISLIFFTQPGTDLLSKLPYTNELYSKGSITVNSTNSVANVTIDGEDYGPTPVELTDLTPGSHTVTLVRETESEENFYIPHTFYIDLQPNTEAIIDVEIGPNDNLAGYVLFYTPAPGRDGEGLFTISSKPEDSLLNIDGEFYSALPLSAETIDDGSYTFEVENEGYESVDFPVIIREGYNLNITTYLMPVPIILEKEDSGGE